MREQTYENKEMMGEIYCHTKGMGGWGCATLSLIELDQDLTWVFTPSGYLYLYHYSLLNHFYCGICQQLWKWYL
jgi:hypothetical protein